MLKQKISLPFEVDSVFGNNSWETINKVANFISDNNLNQKQVLKSIGWRYGDKKVAEVFGEKTYFILSKPPSVYKYLKDADVVGSPYCLNFNCSKEEK